MPGTGLTVVEAKFLLRSFEALLDPTVRVFGALECLEQRPVWAPDRETPQIAVSGAGADQLTWVMV